MFKKSKTIEERFWKYVAKSDDDSCWEWKGTRQPSGYGALAIGYNGKFPATGYAHRVSYQIAFGEIPEGMCVCHHCDNRSCVNPKHLFLGTPKDNTQDMIKKGRRVKRSSAFDTSRIQELIQDMQSTTMSKEELSAKYNACYQTLRNRAQQAIGKFRKYPHTRLSPAQVKAIIDDYTSGRKLQRELADEYGVNFTYISHIVHGRRKKLAN